MFNDILVAFCDEDGTTARKFIVAELITQCWVDGDPRIRAKLALSFAALYLASTGQFLYVRL